MKRYEHFCSYDGGGPADPEEMPDGDWVRYEDAQAEIERLRGALRMTVMLKPLGGMLPGVHEMVQLAVAEAEKAMKETP